MDFLALYNFVRGFEFAFPILRTLSLSLFFFLIFLFIMSFIKRFLLKYAKSKKQISNVKIFSKVVTYTFLLILIILAIISLGGSFTGVGIWIGLLSAALGWALQKPITGIAAWIMVVVKRPFVIGDRVIIGSVRGDVVDISLTHIYLSEIGGIVGGEENSGRIILVPNSILFEQNIINYTSKDEFILDQVAVTVTYESNLDKAVDIIKKVSERVLKECK